MSRKVGYWDEITIGGLPRKFSFLVGAGVAPFLIYIILKIGLSAIIGFLFLWGVRCVFDGFVRRVFMAQVEGQPCKVREAYEIGGRVWVLKALYWHLRFTYRRSPIIYIIACPLIIWSTIGYLFMLGSQITSLLIILLVFAIIFIFGYAPLHILFNVVYDFALKLRALYELKGADHEID